MILPLRGQRQRHCEFEVSLVYRVSSRISRATQRNPVLGEKKKTNKSTMALQTTESSK